MNPIQSALAGISIGEATGFRNLTMFPLIKQDETTATYLTLEEALGLGGIHVTVGAKQNRVFNLTILVPAQTELLVPVSCVEAGRWNHVSPEFM